MALLSDRSSLGQENKTKISPGSMEPTERNSHTLWPPTRAERSSTCEGELAANQERFPPLWRLPQASDLAVDPPTGRAGCVRSLQNRTRSSGVRCLITHDHAGYPRPRFDATCHKEKGHRYEEIEDGRGGKCLVALERVALNLTAACGNLRDTDGQCY